MGDAPSKFLCLVPLSLNDGSSVPEEMILDFKERLFLLADGWTVAGTVEGAYRMRDGRQQMDCSLQFWIWVSESRYPELRQIVSELGAKLGQESMYLERTGGTLDLVPPASEAKENGS